MKRFLFLLVLIPLLLLVLAGAEEPAPQENELIFESEHIRGVYLYVGRQQSGEALPMILWLGSGSPWLPEPEKTALPRCLEAGVTEPRCIVISPWPAENAGPQDITAEELAHLYDAALESLPVDPDRVSIAAWGAGVEPAAEFAVTYPEKLSAVCLISCYPYQWYGREGLLSMPVELLAGADEVTAQGQWQICQRIRDAGGDCHFHRLSGYGHEVGDQIFADETLRLTEWLMAQTRGQLRSGDIFR